MQVGLSYGWFEGEGFYEFFKNGGLTNLLELFKWLKKLIAQGEEGVVGIYQHMGVVVFYEECCKKISGII